LGAEAQARRSERGSLVEFVSVVAFSNTIRPLSHLAENSVELSDQALGVIGFVKYLANS
jgi:hypothetical protein